MEYKKENRRVIVNACAKSGQKTFRKSVFKAETSLRSTRVCTKSLNNIYPVCIRNQHNITTIKHFKYLT